MLPKTIFREPHQNLMKMSKKKTPQNPIESLQNLLKHSS